MVEKVVSYRKTSFQLRAPRLQLRALHPHMQTGQPAVWKTKKKYRQKQVILDRLVYL